MCNWGVFGDITLLIPALLELYRRTDTKPNVIVSETYGNVLDGVSYVTAHQLSVHWSEGIAEAKLYARSNFGKFVVPAWWNDPEATVPPEYRGSLKLTSHGSTHSVNGTLWPNFMASMYSVLGFGVGQMERLPMVFDRRDPVREANLLDRVYPQAQSKRPLLLYNFTGISSPFGHLPDVWPVLQRFVRDFTLVDLGKIKAFRVYDLLGLYDAAVGLLTCDTATLQLAPASPVPYVAFCQDGFLGSTPRGNCVLRIPYAQTLRRLKEVRDVLEHWKTTRVERSTTPVLVPQSG